MNRIRSCDEQQWIKKKKNQSLNFLIHFLLPSSGSLRLAVATIPCSHHTTQPPLSSSSLSIHRLCSTCPESPPATASAQTHPKRCLHRALFSSLFPFHPSSRSFEKKVHKTCTDIISIFKTPTASTVSSPRCFFSDGPPFLSSRCLQPVKSQSKSQALVSPTHPTRTLPCLWSLSPD